MREIKFRLWDQVNEKFIYCDLFDINKGVLSSVDKEDHIPQEYTGLTDRNGQEIYEGDRIIFDNSDIGGQRYEGIVEWNSDQLLDNLCWGLWIPNKGWLHCDFLGDLEVVGNIFEGVDK